MMVMRMAAMLVVFFVLQWLGRHGDGILNRRTNDV